MKHVVVLSSIYFFKIFAPNTLPPVDSYLRDVWTVLDDGFDDAAVPDAEATKLLGGAADYAEPDDGAAPNDAFAAALDDTGSAAAADALGDQEEFAAALESGPARRGDLSQVFSASPFPS